MTTLCFAKHPMITVLFFKIYLLYMRELREQRYSLAIILQWLLGKILWVFFGSSPTTKFEKYLGLPPIIGGAKKKAFREIKDRVWKWKEKLLSPARREVHIKTVIQAIPTHVTSRVVSNFPWVSLRKLEPWLTGFGGVKGVKGRKFSG